MCPRVSRSHNAACAVFLLIPNCSAINRTPHVAGFDPRVLPARNAYTHRAKALNSTSKRTESGILEKCSDRPFCWDGFCPICWDTYREYIESRFTRKPEPVVSRAGGQATNHSGTHQRSTPHRCMPASPHALQSSASPLSPGCRNLRRLRTSPEPFRPADVTAMPYISSLPEFSAVQYIQGP